jgi:hypothetical protein
MGGSHAYHSYLMANTRLCLGVEVLSGKEHVARHVLPGLWQMLDKLLRTQWPTLLRGDCSYGNEALRSQAEARELSPSAFKSRLVCQVANESCKRTSVYGRIEVWRQTRASPWGRKHNRDGIIAAPRH